MILTAASHTALRVSKDNAKAGAISTTFGDDVEQSSHVHVNELHCHVVT